jgi:isomerase DpgB
MLAPTAKLAVAGDSRGGTDLALDICGADPVTRQLIDSVEAVCAAAEDRPGGIVLVRVLAGVADRWPGVDIGLVNKWERALRRLEMVPALTIGVIDGECGGAALEALLTTDYRIATPGSYLVQPATGRDPWPGMSLYRLTTQLGVAAVRHLVVSGAVLNAQEAAAVGIVDKVAEDIDAAVRTAAQDCGDGAALAIRRSLVLEAPTRTFDEALGIHLAACHRALRAADTGA